MFYNSIMVAKLAIRIENCKRKEEFIFETTLFKRHTSQRPIVPLRYSNNMEKGRIEFYYIYNI